MGFAYGPPVPRIPSISREKIYVCDTQARRKTPGLWAATAGAPPVRQLVSRHWESEALEAADESKSHSALRRAERGSGAGLLRRTLRSCSSHSGTLALKLRREA